MTEHELTEEKVAELHNEHSGLHTPTWDRLQDKAKQRKIGLIRAAYDLGKAAQNDDGFLPCEFGDIRKGDTVERTLRYSHGTVVTTMGIASRLDLYDNWRDSDGILLASDNADATYRRKPAPVVHPDPEKHPVILDGDGEAWVWDGYHYLIPGDVTSERKPNDFGNNWRPAKVVAKEED